MFDQLGLGTSQSVILCILTSVSFCSGLHLLHKEASLMGVKLHLSLVLKISIVFRMQFKIIEVWGKWQ